MIVTYNTNGKEITYDTTTVVIPLLEFINQKVQKITTLRYELQVIEDNKLFCSKIARNFFQDYCSSISCAIIMQINALFDNNRKNEDETQYLYPDAINVSFILLENFIDDEKIRNKIHGTAAEFKGSSLRLLRNKIIAHFDSFSHMHTGNIEQPTFREIDRWLNKMNNILQICNKKYLSNSTFCIKKEAYDVGGVIDIIKSLKI